MTGPYYSVGPIRNQLLPASVLATFITAVRNTLLACNWTLVSSFIGTGGSPGYILSSYPTPTNGNIIRLRIWWDGSFSAIYPLVRIDLGDEAGTAYQFCGGITISNDLGNKTLRSICGPHQFFIFLDTTIPPNSNYNRAHDFNNCMGGCPKVKNPFHTDVYWGVGGSATTTFRTDLRSANVLGGSRCFLINGITPGTVFPDVYGDTANCDPVLLSQRSIDLHLPVMMFDGNYPVIEPILVMGRIPHKYYAVNLWDGVVTGNRFTSQVFSTADSRIWESITLGASIEVAGCLFLVTDVLVGITQGGFSY